jgi:hypothetical protein
MLSGKHALFGLRASELNEPYGTWMVYTFKTLFEQFHAISVPD